MLNIINRTAKQTGDTLVEVMISIAIVALAIAIAYSISGKNLNVGITARERGQAAGLVQGQIERMKQAQQVNAAPLVSLKDKTKHFCFEVNNISNNTPVTNGLVDPLNASLGPLNNDAGKYVAACKSADGNYYVDINYVPLTVNPDPTKSSGNSFMFTAKWFRVGGGTDQIVTIYYRPW